MKCIIVDDEVISTEILMDFVSRTKSLELTGTFSTAQTALQFYRLHQNEVDLIFLDIGLPDISGLDLLESLENPPIVIIVSGSDKHALDSYRYEVTDYLLKPLSYGRFYIAVEKALKKNTARKETHCEYLDTCPLFYGRLLGKDSTIATYKKKYCMNGNAGKTACKRFQTRVRFGKCPPDLLPNTELSVMEIGEMYKLSHNWDL